MRVAEQINIVVFCGLLTLGWTQRGLSRKRRTKITRIGLGGIAIALAGAWVLPRYVSPLAASVTRDWLPYILLMMVYWQGGAFVYRVDERFQQRLLRMDARLVLPVLDRCSARTAGNWFLTYLELAYMFCYASLPLGLAAIYLLRMGAHADYFWSVVLVSTYSSYCMLPFIQTLPPRSVVEKRNLVPRPNPVRAFNLIILRHGSIHANTFPSAHVASSVACALVLLWLAPPVGAVFAVVAVSIALGAVAGRYHYSADAILGAAIALLAFLVFTPFR